MMADYQLKALGSKGLGPRRELETFPAPAGLTRVVLESDEVTSLCPVTGQPDWDTVRIELEPADRCIESKSLKLYLWSFREEGVFCEAFAARIASDVFAACAPRSVTVTVTQKPRGGVTITAQARLPAP
jgi:7-cyano-7-deazaguanine reductase